LFGGGLPKNHFALFAVILSTTHQICVPKLFSRSPRALLDRAAEHLDRAPEVADLDHLLGERARLLGDRATGVVVVALLDTTHEAFFNVLGPACRDIHHGGECLLLGHAALVGGWKGAWQGVRDWGNRPNADPLQHNPLLIDTAAGQNTNINS